MRVCTSCAQEFEGEQKLCPSCREALISETWKRQMRTYTIVIVLGVGLLAFDYYQFSGNHYNYNNAPIPLLVATALGGLGLMGGLFGFGLALFFSIWHGRPKT